MSTRSGTPPRRSGGGGALERNPPPLPSPRDVAARQQSFLRAPPKLTAAQNATFKSVDSNNDGRIDKEEALRYAREVMHYKVEGDYMDKLWESFDYNADGVLDPGEFGEFLNHFKEQQGYTVTGAGRLPGSKYAFGEVEINECSTPDELKELWEENAKVGRSDEGCCCGLVKGSPGLPKYIEPSDEHGLRNELDRQLAKNAPGDSGGEPTGTGEADIKDALRDFLGDPPESPVAPPNFNHYRPGDYEGNVLRFNRKIMIRHIYEDEQPAFSIKSARAQKVFIEDNPDDAAIDGCTDVKWLREECEKRGFSAPPYHLLVNDEGARGGADIDGDGVPEGMLIISPKGKGDESVDDPSQVLATHDPKGFLKAGLPGKLKHASLEQLQTLLKLIVKDPRHKNGQPVVTPAFFQRSCQNLPCVLLFWAFWVGMVVVSAVAVATGDPLRLVRPTDYQGNPCGGEDLPTTNGRPNMVYPRITEDVAAMAAAQDGQCVGSEGGCFYGVCVAECPAPGAVVCNYEVEAELAATLPTASARDEARQLRATYRQGCWYNGMTLTNMLFRCFPFEVATETNNYVCVETVEEEVWLSNANRANVTLAGDISTIPPGSPARGAFEQAFRSDLAAALGGISVERVVIKAVVGGSIIVDFEVLPAADGSGLSDSALTQALSSSSSGAAVTLGGLTAVALQLEEGGETTSTGGGGSWSGGGGGRRLSLLHPHHQGQQPQPLGEFVDDEQKGGDDLIVEDLELGVDGATVARRRVQQQGQGGGGGGSREVRTPISTVGLNHRQVERALLQCRGVVEDTQTIVQRYNAGSGEMTGMLTGALTVVTRLWNDIDNAKVAVIVCGPVMAAVLSFLFILFMSRFAALIIWLTIFGCEVALLVLFAATAYQAGLLDEYIVELQNADIGIDNATLATYEVAAQSGRDALDQQQAQISAQISRAGTSDGEPVPEGQEITDPKFYWTILAYVSGTCAALYPLVVCAVRKQIKLATALVKESGRTLSRMKLLLFYPFFTYFWTMAFFVYFVIISTFIFSSTLDSDGVQTLIAASGEAGTGVLSGQNLGGSATSLFTSAQNASDAAFANSSRAPINLNVMEANSVVKGLFVYHLLGYLWTVEYVKAIGVITIAGAIGTDYWIEKSSHFQPMFPVFPAFYRAVRYHVGTAVFGALILAVVRMIRYGAMYVDAKTAELQKDSMAVRVLFKIIHCVLWCLEKCMRFLTESAYILCAIEGTGFCASAWKSFKLIFSNSLRVATTQTLATLIIFLAQIGITAFCTLTCWVVLKELPVYQMDGASFVDLAYMPCALVFVTAFFVSYCFMGVYETAIQTLLLSFCLDEDKFKKGLYKEKRDLHGAPDPRMFCVVNGKVGLIKLVSKEAKSEIKQHSREKKALRKAEEFGSEQLPLKGGGGGGGGREPEVEPPRP